MKARLKGKDYEVNFNYGTYFDFEERSGKTMSEIKGTKDIMELFYSCLVVNNKDFIFEFQSFKTFIAALDDDPENNVEAVCSTHYVLAVAGIKKKTPADQEVKGDKRKEPKILKVSELFGLLVVECGISPDFFLEKMTPLQVEAVLAAYNEQTKNNLTTARKSWFYSVLPWAKEGFEETDLVTFSWEKKEQGEEPTEEEIASRVKQLNSIGNGR